MLPCNVLQVLQIRKPSQLFSFNFAFNIEIPITLTQLVFKVKYPIFRYLPFLLPILWYISFFWRISDRKICFRYSIRSKFFTDNSSSPYVRISTVVEYPTSTPGPLKINKWLNKGTFLYCICPGVEVIITFWNLSTSP